MKIRVDLDDAAALLTFEKFRPIRLRANQIAVSSYLAQCEGKVAWPSYAQAHAAFRHARNKRRHIYRCRYCHQYHVGSGAPDRKDR